MLASLALLASLAPSVAAAEPTFGTPTATSKFGTGIDFSQPVTVDEPIVRAELLLTIANAIGPNITEVPFTPVAGSNTLTYTLDTSGQHHMTPNTPIKARWRVFPQSDPEHGILGPEVKVVYADDRFDWKTVSGDLVRVHWYEGDDKFAAKALKLGEDEVRDTSKLLGVTETEPVDFFVYANNDDFYGALGPGAHENVAGTAVRLHPDASRAHPARPDRRPARRGPDPARVRPSRVRHGVVEPVPRRAALAQRGPGRLPERGLRVGRPARRRIRREVRHAHPARRPDRPVPERPGLLPRLLGERRRGGLHDQDLWQGCARHADPLVRAGADR